MAIERNWRARLRYRSDEFLSGGAGRQLGFLFALSMAIVLLFVGISTILHLPAGDHFLDRAWFYFTRLLDTGTMSGDDRNLERLISTAATISGVVVAGLLISSLAGNFQERLETIKRTGSPVMEEGHYLVLGWSEKIYSVIEQIAESTEDERKMVVVVMSERAKVAMEDALRDRLGALTRVKIVVRHGSSVSLLDLSRVSFDTATAIVVLLDENDRDANAADGRVIKTLLALFNHPDLRVGGGAPRVPRVTAEVMLPENQEIAMIASGGRAQVVKTNEIISKIILQTSRITGLSLVYDELLRFEGSEVHFTEVPGVVGQKFSDVLLDLPEACVIGLAKHDGSGHSLNPPGDHVIAADESLIVVAEDSRGAKVHRAYDGPVRREDVRGTAAPATRPVEQLLLLGWNEKVFPIVEEFDQYVGPGSTLTIVCDRAADEREKLLTERCPALRNVRIEHLVGSFTSRALMEQLQPQRYPTVMVLGDESAGDAEASDTRAIIALLLLRDFRQRAGVTQQEVCSEILNPKNRELAATTEIRDIVISNEMVSMVLAQITADPRVRPVLEDLFAAEGSEIYLKTLEFYAPAGTPVTFEYLVLAAQARGELAIGIQRYVDDPAKRYGITLNPRARREAFVPAKGDRLIVLAEDDG